MAANPNQHDDRTPQGGAPGTNDPGFPNNYTNIVHFRQAEAATRITLVPRGDLTVPDHQGLNACHRQLWDAMNSFNGFIPAAAYDPKARKVLDICVCPQRSVQEKLEAIVPKEYRKYTTPDALEKIAWEVLSDCVAYYQRQWYLLPADTPPSNEIDDFDNFQDRWDAICEVIEMNKIVFRSLIHERSYRKRLICGPKKEDYAKGANERSNIQKAFRSNAGNAALQQAGQDVAGNQGNVLQQRARLGHGGVQQNQPVPQQNQAAQPMIHAAGPAPPAQQYQEEEDVQMLDDWSMSQEEMNSMVENGENGELDLNQFLNFEDES